MSGEAVCRMSIVTAGTVLNLPCVVGCGSHGTCSDGARCECQPGWTGKRCSFLERPSCKVNKGLDLQLLCSDVHRMSPVSCDCLRQCASLGYDICGPAGEGCTMPWQKLHLSRFYRLTCLLTQTSEHPPDGTQIIKAFPYLANGSIISTWQVQGGIVPAYVANLEDRRAAGREIRQQGSVFVPLQLCGGCMHGKCLSVDGHHECWCMEGTFGKHCNHVCDNDCFNDCSGNGLCRHGFCICSLGFWGIDCSSSSHARSRARMKGSADLMLHGGGTSETLLRQVPWQVRKSVRSLRPSVFVYDLPARINRDSPFWSTKYWGRGSAKQCAAVHDRRVYQAQAHFDSHLLHDDLVRTLNPSEASLFYVPTNFVQRFTWGVQPRRGVQMALDYIRHSFPYWNASNGQNHVWFFFQEKPCDMPAEVRDNSIIISHWGASRVGGDPAVDCMRRPKDVVVSIVSPISGDRATHDSIYKPMAHSASTGSLLRNGPLLFFSGGVFGYGASQEYKRKDNRDAIGHQSKLQRRAKLMHCARPEVECRGIYSMGVRQALWREGLWKSADTYMVSAGISNYEETLLGSRFCLHTEGNGWGVRLTDYFAAECIPLIVNDDFIFPYEQVIEYSKLSVHIGKSEIPNALTVLRKANESQLRAAMREHKHAFSWWRPEGKAYEYTLASLARAAAKNTKLRR